VVSTGNPFLTYLWQLDSSTFDHTPETGWPVIVFNHGYIEPDVYSSTEGYIAYMHAFAGNRYIVLRPDYRGNGNSEGEPVNTYFHQGNTIDVLNAVAAVKKWETADPDRIGMWGHSMGGWISLRAMVIDPDIRVGVIWAGVLGSYDDLCVNWFNCANWDEETWTFWSETPFAEYGLPEENEAFWTAASTDTYLSELQAVVQLHHATTDAAVPVALSQVIYEKMLAEGIVVEFYEYPGDDHNISQTFDLAMTRSLDFFDIHLKGTGN
jgi:dipeptidyl aminopeptidase/acylaminoacyl peptidase